MSSARQQLLQRFRSSATERLQRIAYLLLDAGAWTRLSSAVEEMERELHTIKGEARLLGLTELSTLIHQCEELLQHSEGSEGWEQVRLSLQRAIERILAEIQSSAHGAAQVPAPAPAHGPLPEDAPPASSPPGPSGQALSPERWMHVSAMRVDLLQDIVAEFDASFRSLDSRLRLASQSAAGAAQPARLILEDMDRCRGQLDNFISAVWALRLVPVEPTLREMAAHAHELAQGLGKQLRVSLHGGATQIERNVLDALWEPLLHILRNAVDHGLEPPAERLPKSAVAQLTISAEAVGSTALITVQDDGRGIDPVTVRSAAVERGLIEPAQELTDRQLFELLFLHGFSTQSVVNDLSGRGIGLDVVRRSMDAIGGTVALESELGRGTRVSLSVPVRLSKERALVFGYGDTLFALPAHHVMEIVRLQSADVRPVPGGRALWSRFGILPLRSMYESLGFTDGTDENLGLVLRSGGSYWGFALAEILGEFELIRQPCDALVAAIAKVHGCALLPDGRMVLFVATDDLIRALPARAQGSAAPMPSRRRSPLRRRHVLVVDDSAVIRSFATQLLEGSGFAVTAAADGQQALRQLGSQLPDVVLTDIDMPEMDGLELLSRVRAQWPQLPVILFTYHSAPEQQRRALALGASAYVVKSDFSESTLLETVQRFAGAGE